MIPDRVFVTGTDTGVGKTVVAACLVRLLGARYWKPVQTGIAAEPGDTATVTRLTGAFAFAPRFALGAPLSPEAAGRREGVRVRLEDFALPDFSGPLVVEGAGGVLVPLGDGSMMADLMVRLGLPVVVVARSALGTINHSLLTLQFLRARGLKVAGVVMVGDFSPENAEAVAHYGDVRILAQLPFVEDVNDETLSRLVRLFDTARGDGS